MELPSMAAMPITPVGDGPFVEAKGGDDRLDGTAMTEERDHEGDQIELDFLSR